MKYFSFKTFFCLVFAGTVFASCIKKDDFDFSNLSVKMDGSWGVTLVNSEAGVTDFTFDSAINIVSDNNVIKIIYSVPLATSGEIKDLIPMVEYDWPFSLSDIEEPTTTPYTDTTIFSGSQDILFYGDTNSVLIDSVVFNAGHFELKLNSLFEHEVKFKIKSKYFHYSNGKTLDTLIRIPRRASNYSLKIDLEGCRVKLKKNSLPCEIEVIAYNDGLTFSGNTGGVDVDVHGELYVFKYLQGWVAPLTESMGDKLDLPIDNDGKMSFLVQNIKGGKMQINSYNSFGIGTRLTVDTCELVANGGAPMKLLSPANSIFTFDPAPSHSTTKVQSFTVPINEFSIANNNVFRFAGSVLVNEPGITGPMIWATDTSSFSIKPSLEMPLDFNLNHFVYRDTLAQEISKIEGIDFMKNLTFRIDLSNDFPLELKMQIYFLDGNHKAIDSLFSQSTLISAARINPTDGKTLVSGKITPSPLFIEISDARLDKIYNTKYLYIDARATSDNQQTIIRADQKLKIKVGAKATVKGNIKINSNDSNNSK